MKARKLGKVLSAPPTPEARQPVQPDIFFLRTGNQPRWKFNPSFDGVPDLAIEVLSRSTAHRDRKIKFKGLPGQAFGEYWTIDPWNRAWSPIF